MLFILRYYLAEYIFCIKISVINRTGSCFSTLSFMYFYLLHFFLTCFSVLFSGIHILYKKKRHKPDWQLLLHSFIHVFLFASFIYELIDVIWMGNGHLLGYLSLLFVLLLALIMLQNSVSMAILNKGLLFIWGAGQLALAFIMPFATVFGYMMAPWFLSLFLIANILWFLYEKKYIVRR